MDRKHSFEGGVIVERLPGSMIERGTNKEIKWDYGLVIHSMGKKAVIESRAAMVKLLELQEDQEFMDFINKLQ